MEVKIPSGIPLTGAFFQNHFQLRNRLTGYPLFNGMSGKPESHVFIKPDCLLISLQDEQRNPGPGEPG